jgi:hypothetical protein
MNYTQLIFLLSVVLSVWGEWGGGGGGALANTVPLLEFAPVVHSQANTGKSTTILVLIVPLLHLKITLEITLKI